MIAAKLRHKDLVCAILRSNKFQEGCQEENKAVLHDVIHMRNSNKDTLLAMVALQGPELEEQKLLILRKEIQIHVESRLTHEADQIRLQRCLRAQLKSSAEAAIVLDQVRALQGIPKTEHELKMESCKVWTRLFFASLLLSLLFNLVDNGSDILIMIRYYNEYMREINGKEIFGGMFIIPYLKSSFKPLPNPHTELFPDFGLICILFYFRFSFTLCRSVKKFAYM